MAPSALIADEPLRSFLQALHGQSLTQEAGVEWSALPPQTSDAFDDIMRDKFIALDQDKCELVYHILRSIKATTIVEAGTSFGVSTIYLALAAAQNAHAESKPAKVIATEKEPSKAARAQEIWAQAGKKIEDMIDLRIGDLRETLAKDLGEVDFLLLDIWTPLSLPALKAVQPSLRRGAVIVADNTLKATQGYQDLFDYVDAEGSGFKRVTLPYTGGLDMVIYQ
ncbi:uncharacterized protein PFLUO_LOCUS2370 [Penicillium psychrofluorescens]|uniref:uncharacterized protein n=1 Tax=Penicillium psychrofluorescens TaxID=3158075 RepID=UPI003CCD9577